VRVAWARATLRSQLPAHPRLVDHIELPTRRSGLGKAYENGNVFALRYSLSDLPPHDEVALDLSQMLPLLGALYAREDIDPPHTDVTPEVREAEDAAAATAQDRSARKRSRQGFRLSGPSRQAVEKHAVDVAQKHLETEGWACTDVGAKESYDIHCTREDAILRVEVKGTTSSGGQVVLTHGEVVAQRRYYPENALIVVSHIDLQDGREGPLATGGEARVIRPWPIADDGLRPISYTYMVPPEVTTVPEIRSQSAELLRRS
jgi:hypothetical protein